MNKWDDNTLKEIAQRKADGASWAELGEQYDTTSEAVRKAVFRFARRGWSPEHDMSKEVPEGYVVKGTSTLYGPNGEPKLQWVKSSIDTQRQETLLREIIEGMSEELPRLAAIPQNENFEGDVMSTYVLGDAHVGMMSWAEETGEDWDLKIAQDIHEKTISRLVDATPESEVGVLINLGDFFHYDSMHPVTPASGHMLDTDTRYAKMVRIGVRILRNMIDSLLYKHKEVRVVNVRGNHDPSTTIFLSVALKNLYENEPRVIIDDNPSKYSYIRFGKCLLGITHGDKVKLDRLPGVMATDKAAQWGKTRYRYWLTGHVHHQQVKEYPGVIVESFNTLAAKDEYAHSGGYRAQRSCKALVYHREYGEIERHIVNVDMLKEK